MTRSEMFRQNGYRALLASCAAEALALFQKELVDLGVIDLRLRNDCDPRDISGILLARRLASYIHTIILTGHPDVSAVRSALGLDHEGRAAAFDFVAKSEGFEVLLSVVEKAQAASQRERSSTLFFS